MSGLRALVTEVLVDAGVYIDDARFDRVRVEAAAVAAEQFRPALRRVCGQEPSAVAASVGLSAGALARIFGHGWQQAAGFAALAEVRPHRVADVARLGALLSLGIVLFDQLVDVFPGRRAELADRLTLRMLTAPQPVPAHPAATPATRVAASGPTSGTSSGDLGVDCVAALALAVMSGARRLAGRPDDLDRFHDVIGAMHRGELASLQARTADESPSAAVWEALNAKSALPTTAVATLTKLANPHAPDPVRAAVDHAALLVGEAFWIIDDLVDAHADWDAGRWSRPLWLLLEHPGQTPADGEDAVRRLVRTGIVAAEARRLGRLLGELAILPGGSQRTLSRPVQAAVRSWVEEIPAR